MEPGFALFPANFLAALYNIVRPAYSNILVCVFYRGCTGARKVSAQAPSCCHWIWAGVRHNLQGNRAGKAASSSAGALTLPWSLRLIAKSQQSKKPQSCSELTVGLINESIWRGSTTLMTRNTFTWEQKGHLCKTGLWKMTLPSGRLLQASWEISFGNTETKDKVCVKECCIILPCYVISVLGNQITRKRMKTYGFGELGSLTPSRNKWYFSLNADAGIYSLRFVKTFKQVSIFYKNGGICCVKLVFI